ncbi:MAG: Bax inhibitor-1/YccA family protein [Proteobacteria bacterium]|nr:Bax inhibitor-1/YccA family protein [Pseudomonadota bacterium]
MSIHNFPARGAMATGIITSNRVLRNTYNLLSITLLFSAFVAYVSMSLNLPNPGIIVTLIGFYGLLFCIHKTRNSGYGLLFCFALTGFMGYTLGPMLSYYLNFVSNGGQMIALAFSMTAALFLSLSLYGATTKRDLSFLSGLLLAGIVVVVIGIVASLFLQVPMLQLAISAVMVPLMSVMIVYETNMIVKGHQTNYILATVSLFVAIYNLFLSLLNILSAFRE